MEKKALRDLCELIIDCPHSTPKWTDKGVIVLRNQYIKNGCLDLSNPSYTDEKSCSERIKRAVPSEGDVVLTREAPMGDVCLIPKGLRCCLGQRMVLLRSKANVMDNRYLFYALQSSDVKHQIGWNEGTGSVVSNMRIPLIESLMVPCPPLETQKEIAHILGTLDDKIELNRRMNKTLEEISQTLYKHWFIDFEFPNEEGRPYKSSGGEMVDSELGMIPKGWKTGKLGDICSFRKQTITPSKTNIENYRHYSIPAYDNGQYAMLESSDSILSNKYIVPDKCVLLSKLNPRIKRLWYIDSNSMNKICSTEFLVLDSKSYCPEYLYCTLSEPYYYDGLVSSVTGTSSSHQRLEKEQILSLDIIIPETNIKESFESFVSSLFDLRENNKNSTISLDVTKLNLMSRLFNEEYRA